MSEATTSTKVQQPLSGEYPTTVDEKYRLLIPQDLRENLGENFAMALSEYGCILVLTEAGFMERWATIQSASVLDPARRRYSREFMRYSASKLNVDKQGRVVIPSFLRDRGGLKDEDGKLLKDVILIGAGDRIEVWNPDQMAKYEEDMDGYGGERQARMDSDYMKLMSKGAE